MNNEVAVRASVEAEISGFEMKPRTLKEAMDFCELMANSDLVPTTYKGKPGNIMVAIQMGNELNLSPMRALRCIAVINGRASMWGDELLAMVKASPVCEWVHEQESTEECGVCEVKRKDDPKPLRSTFTLADAKRAGLFGKAGPWQQYTKRMLTLRARGFALRDQFPDVLAGLVSTEEALDMPAPEAEAHEPETVLTLKDKLKAQLEPRGAWVEPPPAPPEPSSVHEPAVEEVMEDIEKAAALSMPTPGNPPSVYTFTDKLDHTESVKEWADVRNAALEYIWNAEQAKTLNDHADIAMKRLKGGTKKK